MRQGEPMSKPRVYGAHGLKIRAGRGFSIEELKQAGITLAEARKLKIPVDKRRKTAHEWNIEELRKLAASLRKAQQPA